MKPALKPVPSIHDPELAQFIANMELLFEHNREAQDLLLQHADALAGSKPLTKAQRADLVARFRRVRPPLSNALVDKLAEMLEINAQRHAVIERVVKLLHGVDELETLELFEKVLGKLAARDVFDREVA